MSAQALKNALFGKEISGTIAETGQSWRECIDPDGNTRFTLGNRTINGRLRVDASNQACFAYESSRYRDWVCWDGAKSGAHIVFSRDGSVTFRVEQTRNNIRSCAPEDVPIG